MRIFFYFQTLLICKQYQNHRLFDKKILFSKNFIKIYLFDVPIRKYAKGHDHNFYFFHQNPLYSGSFFQIPLKTCKDVVVEEKSIDKIKDVILRDGLTNVTKHEIIEIMNWMIQNIDTNPIESASIWKFLDNKCSLFIDSASFNETLYVFDMWYILLNHKAFSTKYFMKVVDFWFQNLELMSKDHIVQVLYYLGKHKKMSPKMVFEKLKTIESKMCEMSDVEFSIVCLNLFKLRVKSVSVSVKQKAVNVAKSLISSKERFHLISVLKFLRQMQYYDQGLYDLLCQFIIEQWSSFNFVEITHFLATFSTQAVYENGIFEALENHGATLLQREISSQSHKSEVSHYHPSLRCRVKDLSRYLWSMVSVGHQVKQDTIKIMLSVVKNRYSLGEYEIHLDILVDFLQSLAIINVYPIDLIKWVFAENFLFLLKRIKKDKPLHQIFFVYKSMEIECPDIIKWVKLDKHVLRHFMPVPKNMEEQVKNRINLSNVLSYFKQMEESESNVKLCCSLPHIAILGLEILWNPAKNDKTISDKLNIFHVEILDTSVCCRNSEQPIGFMMAKLRQLKKLNCNVIVLTEADISLLNKMPSHYQKEQLQKLFRFS